LGIPAPGHRRPLPRRLLGNIARRKASLLPALSLQRVALLQSPWRQGSARHDRQRHQFPIPPLPQGSALAQIKHLRTKPYTPKTNGKAERFVQTSLREWAYAQAYLTSDHRAQHLPTWLHRYNWHRPHSSLKSKPPISRLGLTKDNLLRLHN
jgi:transposase InsO family protein